MSIPVGDTLSRLFERVPEYEPSRARSPERKDRAAKTPGVFKVQEIADLLETTVGDLLGEPGYRAPRDLVSTEQRRTLRQATQILRELFDLDDESLDVIRESRDTKFPVKEHDFIERDHDYPRTLHAWVVPELSAAAGNSGAEPELTLASAQILHSVREVWDARLQVIRVIGDSMAPELRHGWKVLVDTDLTHPTPDALVAVYLKDEGGILGRWTNENGRLSLRKTNPDFAPIALGPRSEWTVWGTVTKVVEAPVALRGS